MAILSRLDKIEMRLAELSKLMIEEPLSESEAAKKMGINLRTLQNKRYRGLMLGTFIRNKAGVIMYFMSKVNMEG